jgi:hypothetical protein
MLMRGVTQIVACTCLEHHRQSQIYGELLILFVVLRLSWEFISPPYLHFTRTFEFSVPLQNYLTPLECQANLRHFVRVSRHESWVT